MECLSVVRGGKRWVKQMWARPWWLLVGSVVPDGWVTHEVLSADLMWCTWRSGFHLFGVWRWSGSKGMSLLGSSKEAGGKAWWE